MKRTFGRRNRLPHISGRLACLLVAIAVAARGADWKWVTDADVEKIAEQREVRKLDLSLSLITDAGMERLQSLDKVTDLNLFSVELITDTAIAYIRGWKHLERLNLRGTDVTDTCLQYIASLASLKSLDISDTQVTNNGLEYLPALRNLEELSLGGNKITGAGLRVLRTLPTLRSLDLYGVQRRNSGHWSVSLTDFDLDIIAALSQLQELNLGGAKITDLGITKLKSLTSLRVLDLSKTQVTSAGLESVALLAKLERLSLWQATRVDDGAVQHLSKLPNLVTLDLSGTQVTDGGLAGLGNLRKLYLEGTRVTATGVESFRRNHPQCQVSWR